MFLLSFAAEKILESIESQEGYALMLLKLIKTQSGNISASVPLASAIAFKNFVKRNWRIVSNSIYVLWFWCK